MISPEDTKRKEYAAFPEMKEMSQYPEPTVLSALATTAGRAHVEMRYNPVQAIFADSFGSEAENMEEMAPLLMTIFPAL